MNPEQETDLKELHAIIFTLVSEKYRRGAEEHGGDLNDLPVSVLLDELQAEIIDALIYVIKAKEKLATFKEKHGNTLPETHIRSVHDLPTNQNLY